MNKQKKIGMILGLFVIILGSGCATLPPSTGVHDYATMTNTFRNRTKYVATFAFQMPSVQPHKDQICEAIDPITIGLEEYDDPNATLDNLRGVLRTYTNKITDATTKTWVSFLGDMALTETFNYAQKYYADALKKDSVHTVLAISKGISLGLRDSCKVSVSLMSVGEPITEELPDNVFTLSPISH